MRVSDQACALVAHIANRYADLEPFEVLGRLSLLNHHMLGALLGCGRVEPFPCQFRRKHHRSPVMNVDHAAGAVGGDDHKAVVLPRAFIAIGKLADGGTQYR